jgi:hypothetical protein
MCRIVAHQTDQFEIVEHQRLDELFKLEAAVQMPAISVYLGRGAQALDAGILEALEGLGELPAVSKSLPKQEDSLSHSQFQTR